MSEPSHKTILLVEDEAIVSISQKMSLEKYGYNVVTANSGGKALIIFTENSKIDLVLMDIDLGEGLNGPDTAKLMLQEKDMPIVFVSSHSEPEVVETTEKIASYGYVVKNSGIAVLDASIKMAFRLFDADRNLRNQKNEYDDLYNNAPCGYHTLSPDGIFLSINDTELKWIGYSREELIGKKKMTDLLRPEAREAFNKGFTSVKQDGYISNFENSIVRKDGSIMHVLVTANAVYDENGNFLMSRGTLTDITERHKSRKTLLESEEKYRTLFENMEYGVFYQSADGRLVDINPAGLKMLGISREHLMERTSYSPEWNVIDEKGITLEPEQHPSMIALKTGMCISSTAGIFNSAENRCRWVNVNAIPQFMPGDEKPFRVFATMYDITDRKHAEDELKEMMSRYRNLFSTSPLPIEFFNAKGYLIEANEACLKLFGVSDIDKVRDYNLFRDPNLTEELRQQLRNGEVVNYSSQYNFDIMTEKGILDTTRRGIMHHDVIISPVFSGTGNNSTGYIVIVQDATRRVEAENTGRIRNEELNTVMEEMESANEELIAANEMLMEREKELFASREKYRVIFENRHYAVCIFDFETREFLDVNRAFTEMYGYSREEIFSGMRHSDITVQPEESDESIARTVVDGATYIPIRYHRKKDGSVFPVEIVGEQFDWMGRRVMFGMMNDITDRISLGKSIKESEEKYRVIFDMAIYGICIYDIESFIMLDINAAFTDMYGYTREELLSGMTIMDLSAEQVDTRNAIERVKLDRSIYIPLRYHRRKDSSVFPIEIVGGVYQWAGRDVIFGIFHDITERKKAEDDVKTLLGEKELILREVHHRIKNNMSSIYGLLLLQADSLKNMAASRALTDAANRVKSMVILYDKLYRVTDFQEISPGHYFSILTDEIIASFRYGSRVKVEKDIDDFTVDVKVLQPMGIIVNELLTNVMKHAFAGREEGIVKVSVKAGLNELVFIIADNGKGLPEEINFKSSAGFGMHLVSMLAEQVGADISIKRGDWTEFIVVLKL